MTEHIMITTTSSASSDLLRRLVIATWGVCCGVLIATAITAALIAVRGDTQTRQHPALLSSIYLGEFHAIPWQESYERMWYTLVCVAGALCGGLAARFVHLSSWLAAPAVIAFVPVASWACRGVFSANPSIERLLACAGILALPLMRLSWQTQSEGDEASGAPASVPPAASPRTLWFTAAILCLPLTALLYGLLGPHHVPTVASECNTELHVASYILGPALYYRAPEAVPGLDFESHYGIGHAYAFSHVMGDRGLQRALERFVLFMLALTTLYYLSALFVLTDWLQNPWAALAVTLSLVMTVCSGLSYNYASNWPVRHPFLFVFLFAAVRGADNWRWCAAAGAIAGLSLFWQTDIGLYTIAAGIAFFTAGWIFRGTSAWRPVAFLAAGLGSFFALCLVLFGPRVLSVTFVERLLEPLLLYATGFGNYLMLWRQGWGYWYNVFGPTLAVGSVAVLIGHGRRGVLPPREVLYGAAASFLGLAMLFKWVNRSIDILWWFNGGLVVAVAGWWAFVGWRALAKRLSDESRPLRGYIRQTAAASIILALVVAEGNRELRAKNTKFGQRSPIVQTASWLNTFRNPINAARREIERRRIPSPVDKASARFLHERTHETERVAVICGAEWNFLASAGRAPRLYWLQLFLVHSPVLLDRTAEDLRNAERVFVDRTALASLKGINPLAYAKITPIITERFELAEDSPTRWQIYRRKPGATAGR
jgi:hypothetical protein